MSSSESENERKSPRDKKRKMTRRRKKRMQFTLFHLYIALAVFFFVLGISLTAFFGTAINQDIEAVNSGSGSGPSPSPSPAPSPSPNPAPAPAPAPNLPPGQDEVPPTENSYEIPQQRNPMLWIMVDDLSTLDDIPDELIPNMRRLEREGFVFQNAHVQAALCAPSRNSAYTGVHTITMGTNGFAYKELKDGQKKAGNVQTINEFFIANRGYNVYSYGKVFHHAGDEYKKTTVGGRQTWTERPVENKAGRNTWVCRRADGVSCPGGGDDVLVVTDGSSRKPAPGGKLAPSFQFLDDSETQYSRQERYFDEHATNNAIQKLKDLRGRDDWLMLFGFFKPHMPYIAPKEFLEKAQKYRFEQHSNTATSAVFTNFFKPKGGCSLSYDGEPYRGTENYEDMRLYYHATVAYIDSLLGRLLAEIDDNVVVAFTSDHGFHYGDRNKGPAENKCCDKWSKRTVLEQVTRIPMIFKHRDIRPGRSIAPVELIDVYPTLVDFSQDSFQNSPPQGQIDGTSLVPIITQKNKFVKAYARTIADVSKYEKQSYRTVLHRHMENKGGGGTTYTINYLDDPIETKSTSDNNIKSYFSGLSQRSNPNGQIPIDASTNIFARYCCMKTSKVRSDDDSAFVRAAKSTTGSSVGARWATALTFLTSMTLTAIFAYKAWKFKKSSSPKEESKKLLPNYKGESKGEAIRILI